MTKNHEIKRPSDTSHKQFFSFVVTGTISSLIMFVIYVGLNLLINYQWSYFISYVISVIALYFMNALFVFKIPVSLSSFLQFPLIYILQYGIGAVSLGFLVRMGIPVTFAPLVVIIILLPLTFLLNRIVLLH